MTTTNLGLTEPTVGADSDTWGDELDTIITALDAHLAGVLYGLTLSAAGSTATFGIAAGSASGMTLAGAYTKTTSAWGVGTGQGALDTGAIANSTWYHVYLIQRPDTLVVDVLVSLSATSPTMPTNYTRKRRIGSMRTDGSAQWQTFTQRGDVFLWNVARGDAVAVAAGATTALTKTLTVPTGVQVDALFNYRVEAVGGNSGNSWVSSFDQTDTAPDTSCFTQLVPAGASECSALAIRTNTSGQIRLRFNNTTPEYYISTYGWIDRRGRD